MIIKFEIVLDTEKRTYKSNAYKESQEKVNVENVSEIIVSAFSDIAKKYSDMLLKNKVFSLPDKKNVN